MTANLETDLPELPVPPLSAPIASKLYESGPLWGSDEELYLCFGHWTVSFNEAARHLRFGRGSIKLAMSNDTNPNDVQQLIAQVQAGERRALARMLTLVESGQAPNVPTGATQGTLVVGITGSGGAGKSTLVGALAEHLRRTNLKVGMLACDPQSPVTGGALLGDRVRVPLDPSDNGIFFRSLSTRGAAGGISNAVGPAIEWLKVFGCDVVLVETVGVGQDQIAIRPLVDRLVLVVTPASGDEVQWEKAGLIELADIIVVNKSDLPGAERVEAQLLGALSLNPNVQAPPVHRTMATTRQGIAELWQLVTSAG